MRIIVVAALAGILPPAVAAIALGGSAAVARVLPLGLLRRVVDVDYLSST